MTLPKQYGIVRLATSARTARRRVACPSLTLKQAPTFLRTFGRALVLRVLDGSERRCVSCTLPKEWWFRQLEDSWDLYSQNHRVLPHDTSSQLSTCNIGSTLNRPKNNLCLIDNPVESGQIFTYPSPYPFLSSTPSVKPYFLSNPYSPTNFSAHFLPTKYAVDCV
jgi:hypothetical protein